jgi:hypothetical protein
MDIIENHPDLIKFDNNRNYNRRMQINFTDDVLLEFIDKAMETIDFSPDEYNINEVSYEIEERYNDWGDGATKKWHVEIFPENDDDFQTYFNYDTYNSQPTHLIGVAYFECIDGNFVELYDVGTSRTKYCRTIIILLKHYFLKLERAKLARYLSREQLLLLTYSCINNYDNFTPEDIKQINLDKTTSKKRRVLENPWALRELLEYIDA